MRLIRPLAIALLLALTPAAFAGESAEGQSIVITRTLTTVTNSTGTSTTWKITLKCGSNKARDISIGEYLQFYADSLHQAEATARSHKNTTSGQTKLDWVSNYDGTSKTETDVITSTTSFVGKCR